MKKLFWVLLSTALFVSATRAQDIVGDWKGTLKAGGAELRLVLHISKDNAGAFQATLDSIDQGANGIPVSSITLHDSNLKFTVNAVNGSYEGKVNTGATSIDGTWTQGQPLPLNFERGTFETNHKPAKPSDIDGAWTGTLDLGTAQLRVVFHFLNTADGLTATFDSPDQGAHGIPVTSVTRNGSALKIEMKSIGASYDGKISGDLGTITGTFTQMGRDTALTLTRAKDSSQLEPKKPQNPSKPYPYREEDVLYDNKVQGVKLGATLTIPNGVGPFPAVVLITGSGQQDRDETILGHRPFLVLADYLTRRGIAVLRADDRGIGKSTGNFAESTTADFATDTEAGIAFLKTRAETDRRKLGLIGHSEGAIIAAMVASRNRDVAFIVMMGGPGVPGDELLPAQVAAILESNGKSRAEAEKNAEQEREILSLAEHVNNDTLLQKKIFEILHNEIPEAQLQAQIEEIRSPWFQYFLKYDPAVALRQVKCPVLAITGQKDTQVPPEQNLPAIRKALQAAGNKDIETVEMPGLNHLLQTAKTGAPSEYSQIEETISPLALEKIANWILKQAALLGAPAAENAGIGMVVPPIEPIVLDGGNAREARPFELS